MKSSIIKSRFSLWIMIMLVAFVLGVLIVIALPKNSDSSAPHRASVGLYASPELGLLVSPNLQVLDVVKGGAADKAGIKKGDILTALNSLSLTEASRAKKAFTKLDLSKSLLLRVNRGTKELKFEVTPSYPEGAIGDPTPTPAPAGTIFF